MKELWFNAAVCDFHWHYIAGDRQPIRIVEQFDENGFAIVADRCVKCGDALTSPIYVRASWRYNDESD